MLGPLSVTQQRETRRWLQLGVLALAIAGLFAILLVLSRSPGMEQFFPWIDFFRTALVVHVDQSVLIWFLAMAGVVWSLAYDGGQRTGLAFAAYLLMLAGTVGIALAAFYGSGAPLMNNYVPVLQRPLFFGALGLVGIGVALRLVLLLSQVRQRKLFNEPNGLVRIAAFTVAVACATAIIVLIYTWISMPTELDGAAYYEYLFWGAGHVLQFAYTQLLLLAWLLLLAASGARLPVRPIIINGLVLLGLLPLLWVVVIYARYDPVSAEMRIAFTQLMQYGGGFPAIPVGLLVIYSLFQNRHDLMEEARPLRMALWMSLLLFGLGGLIAMMITGINTVIPAHYHGSIVGVTLALMGFAYMLLPKLGYAAVTGRLAAAQPIIYGVGQILHVGGLAVSGFMGIQRKTAGAAQGLESLSAKLAMGVMGIGGLLAVIGGILFVWIMLRAFMKGPENSATEAS
ncbi:cbb3-type cytochrome c oxidase subunit I [Sedimenticola selenatireducens]|uniref:cbb3-type cytochrome c oxidase subunit I n=1 Tax=Sedimenticola selenatireducens TaxID=191960 RepID=UPI0021B38E53|nr:cbb3-type cytochrome c oxidase subunit I [Sedimenticola selenatireducens]